MASQQPTERHERSRLPVADQLRQPRRQLTDLDGAGGAVEERDAVQQDAARERAEDEVLERGLDRLRLALEVAGQDVARQRHQLERDPDRQQAETARHQHHAGGRGQQDQRVELSPAGNRSLRRSGIESATVRPVAIRSSSFHEDRVGIEDEHAAQDRFVAAGLAPCPQRPAPRSTTRASEKSSHRRRGRLRTPRPIEPATASASRDREEDLRR